LSTRSRCRSSSRTRRDLGSPRRASPKGWGVQDDNSQGSGSLRKFDNGALHSASRPARAAQFVRAEAVRARPHRHLQAFAQLPIELGRCAIDRIGQNLHSTT
jgi:hypothetical protein